MINSLFIAAAVKSAEAAAFYTDHLAGHEQAGHLPADLLAPARRTVDEARLRIATADGALAGVFAMNPLVREAVVVRGRLQRMNASTGILNIFLDDYLTSDPTAAFRKLKEQAAWIDGESVDSRSLIARSLNDEEMARAMARSAEQAYNQSVESFVKRLWVSTGAAMYCAAFLMVSLRSRWRLLRRHAA
jgi:hypothetical protein